MKNNSSNVLASLRKLIVLGGLSFGIMQVPAYAELIISSGSGANNSAVVKTVPQSNNSTNPSTGVTINQQVPTEASVLKLMQVMRVNEQIDAIINSQRAVADILQEQNNKPSIDDKKLTKRQHEMAKNVQGILAQYTQILAGGVENSVTKEELTQSYITAAKAHYSQQEVDALIGFYDTPMGQSILDKNPQVTSEFLKAALPSEEEMKQTTDQLEKLGPQIKELIKGIF